MSIGEAATSLCLYRKLQQPRVFCCEDVAVSIGEAATSPCLKGKLQHPVRFALETSLCL